MEYRMLGRGGLKVSVLGYGAGAVGGLLVRGSVAEQDRSVGRAIEAGITYFDTAPSYGNGASETNLGRALRGHGAADVVLGTKYHMAPGDRERLGAAIAASVQASLRRLGRDSVDLLQLHDPVFPDGSAAAAGGYSVRQMLHEAAPALARLRDSGLCRCIGITGLGDAGALRTVLDAGIFDTAQLPYNLLNPSVLDPLPASLPGQDFQGVMRVAAARGVGIIGIRILAGGALSGDAWRHPLAMEQVAPIGSAATYAEDVANARRLLPLLAEGAVASLAELAVCFALTPPAMGTALIGTASLEQLEAAIAAAERGPLPAAVLARAAALLG